MSARLVPLNPASGSVSPILVQRHVLLIGRHSECDVRINLPQISRRHCCIAVAYERLLIRDLGSRNGVRVNGLLVEESALRPGDEVAIAQVIYRVEEDREPPTPKIPSPTKPSAPSPAPPRSSELDDLIPLD